MITLQTRQMSFEDIKEKQKIRNIHLYKNLEWCEMYLDEY